MVHIDAGVMQVTVLNTAGNIFLDPLISVQYSPSRIIMMGAKQSVTTRCYQPFKAGRGGRGHRGGGVLKTMARKYFIVCSTIQCHGYQQLSISD